jgi:lipocalin
MENREGQAIVTSSSYDYFRVLARGPRLDKTLQEELLNKAVGFGFERARMELVEQE